MDDTVQNFLDNTVTRDETLRFLNDQQTSRLNGNQHRSKKLLFRLKSTLKGQQFREPEDTMAT